MTKKVNKSKKVNLKRRKQLENVGKTLLTLGAMSVLPSVVRAGNVDFKPKGGSSTLYMSSTGSVGIGTGSGITGGKKLDVAGDTRVGGTLVTTGTVSIGSAGTLSYYAADPTATLAGGSAILGYYGNFYATKVYGAVWNDLADFRKLASGQKKIPGKVYIASDDGVVLATKRAQKGTVGVCSDTFGMALGGSDADPTKAPIAISGWALAYVDKKYEIGTPLVSGKDGNLTKANILDNLLHPERIVGTVETSPQEYNKLKVDGRYWVKVK